MPNLFPQTNDSPCNSDESSCSSPLFRGTAYQKTEDENSVTVCSKGLHDNKVDCHFMMETDKKIEVATLQHTKERFKKMKAFVYDIKSKKFHCEIRSDERKELQVVERFEFIDDTSSWVPVFKLNEVLTSIANLEDTSWGIRKKITIVHEITKSSDKLGLLVGNGLHLVDSVIQKVSQVNIKTKKFIKSPIPKITLFQHSISYLPLTQSKGQLDSKVFKKPLKIN